MSGAMRLLALTADYSPTAWSGIGPAVQHQTGALAAQGLEVHLLLADRQQWLSARAAAGTGQALHLLAADRCPVDPAAFDLLHLHSLALAELALEMRRRSHRPLVYTAHSLIHLELPAGRLARFWSAVQAETMRASDHVLFLSQADRAAALARWPALAGRSSVLPNGVPPPDSIVAVRPERPEGGPIVFAGRFAASKGVALLAALIPAVLAAEPGSHFVLAGGHGDREATGLLAQVAARFPEQCRLAGWLGRPELESLFSRAAMVLVPSQYEPFGLVALEAMRQGAPVLAAAAGGLPEVVGPGSGGRLLASREVADWLAAVRQLRRPEVNRPLRRRGPRYVARHFDPRPLARRLVAEVYERLAPSPVTAGAAARQWTGLA